MLVNSYAFGATGPTASPHRYWRILMEDDSSGNLLTALAAFAEMEMRETVGGSDVTGSGTASASSTFSGFTAAGAFANDGVTTEFATNSPGLPGWLKYDFGSGVTKAIVEIAIQPRNSPNINQAPGPFKIQSSDDDSTWTDEWWVGYPGGANGHGYAGSTLKVFTKPVVDQSPSANRHRYWRISITGSNGGSFVGANEVQLRTVSGGVNEATGGTASSTSNFAGLPPANAFDRSTSTEWASNNVGFPERLIYDFGAGKAYSITQVAYLPRAATPTTQSPTGFDVQYSDDNSSWTTLWSESSITGWAASTWKIFTKP